MIYYFSDFRDFGLCPTPTAFYALHYLPCPGITIQFTTFSKMKMSSDTSLVQTRLLDSIIIPGWCLTFKNPGTLIVRNIFLKAPGKVATSPSACVTCSSIAFTLEPTIFTKAFFEMKSKPTLTTIPNNWQICDR